MKYGWIIKGNGKMIFEEGKEEISVNITEDSSVIRTENFFPHGERPIWLRDAAALEFVLRIITGEKIDNKKIVPCSVEINSNDKINLEQVFISVKEGKGEREFLER